MPRHTIHEVAVNAKLTAEKFGGLIEKESGLTVFEIISEVNDAQLIDFINDAISEGGYSQALSMIALLAERQNNQRRKAELEELNK